MTKSHTYTKRKLHTKYMKLAKIQCPMSLIPIYSVNSIRHNKTLMEKEGALNGVFIQIHWEPIIIKCYSIQFDCSYKSVGGLLR
jgi:hypothetical protein